MAQDAPFRFTGQNPNRFTPNSSGEGGNYDTGAFSSTTGKTFNLVGRRAAEDKAKADSKAAARAAANKARELKTKQGLKLVNASSAEKSSGKTVMRQIIRNPARSDLRETARIAGRTQYSTPTLGVS